jgi:hypothetical protein
MKESLCLIGTNLKMINNRTIAPMIAVAAEIERDGNSKRFANLISSLRAVQFPLKR